MKRRIIRKAVQTSDADGKAADVTPASKPKASKTTRRQKVSTVQQVVESKTPLPKAPAKTPTAEPQAEKAKLPRARSQEAIQKSESATPRSAELSPLAADPKPEPGT